MSSYHTDELVEWLGGKGTAGTRAHIKFSPGAHELEYLPRGLDLTLET